MNLIDGYVIEVLGYRVKKNSELWELEAGEEDKINHIYEVKYIDEGGEHTKELWFENKNDDIKKGYRFSH